VPAAPAAVREQGNADWIGYELQHAFHVHRARRDLYQFITRRRNAESNA